MNTGKRRDQSVNPGCMECFGFTHHEEHCSFWEAEELTLDTKDRR